MSDAIIMPSLFVATMLGATLLWALFRRGRSPQALRSSRFVSPADEQELIALIRSAAAAGRQIRVFGSGHSVRAAIHTDGGDHLDLVLDQLRHIVDWDDDRMQVTVQAGCNLGVDPQNPHSSVERSFLRQLEARGWALPDLGGITDQTVGGFLTTGSAGGSVMHGFGDAVVRLRLIDGRGRVHVLEPDPGDPHDEQTNPFYAAGVSLGLLGIVTEVTFQCTPRYDLIGDNETRPIDEAPVDLFEDGPGGLVAHLRRTPYTRLFWWHQRGLHKLQIWSARRTTPEDRDRTHPGGVPQPRPLAQIPGGRLGQRFLGALFSLANAGPRPMGRLRRLVLTPVFNAMLASESQAFWGPWLDVLPMDDPIDHTILPCSFTELFIPLERTPEVMRTLQECVAQDPSGWMGTFAIELYAGKRSRFWLSPSYGADMLRVDVVEIARGRGRSERDLFAKAWAALAPFDFRYHWAKHMAAASGELGHAYVRQRYPMWRDFMRVREHFDPDQLFVSTYWREHLGIPRPARSRSPAGHPGPRAAFGCAPATVDPLPSA